MSTYLLFILLPVPAVVATITPCYLYSYPTNETYSTFERDFFYGQSRAIGVVNVGGGAPLA